MSNQGNEVDSSGLSGMDKGEEVEGATGKKLPSLTESDEIAAGHWMNGRPLVINAMEKCSVGEVGIMESGNHPFMIVRELTKEDFILMRMPEFSTQPVYGQYFYEIEPCD